jgi:hypothetical protein
MFEHPTVKERSPEILINLAAVMVQISYIGCRVRTYSLKGKPMPLGQTYSTSLAILIPSKHPIHL